MAPSLVKRQLLRARNGTAYAAGLIRAEVEQTPRDLVWKRETARLWRYRSERRRHRTPVLLVHSLVSKSYILDLMPGNSMVEYLRDEGFDVFLLDWEPAGPADAENTIETYADDLIPKAIEATGADEMTLVGYCYAGVLVLLTAATRADLPIRNLVTLTTPCDYRELGFIARMFVAGRLDPEDVIDDTGLVPAAVMDAGFQAIKPTDQAVQQWNLWQNLWSDRRLESYLAVNRWTRDQVPFPGAAFRQTVDVLIRDNAMCTGSVPYNGGEARLRDIKQPYLNVFCREDTIVPAPAAAPLRGLVGSRDATELCLESGHIGLVAGRYAAEVGRPAIADWIRRHSVNRKKGRKRAGHPARAAAG